MKRKMDKPREEITAPHVQGYPVGWLTGHWEFDKVLIRAYRIIPEKDMKALRRQLRQVRLTPYTHKRSDGGWAHGASVKKTGTVLIRPDVIKRGCGAMLIVILHELAHQVDFLVLSPITRQSRREGEDCDVIWEWAAVLRVADWGYDFELRRALRGDGWPYMPSEEKARQIAHRIRSICGSWYGLVRDLDEWREACARHLERGATVEDIDDEHTDDEKATLDERLSPKTLLGMINTVIVVDRLFDLWGYKKMNPKFVPRMLRAYEEAGFG